MAKCPRCGKNGLDTEAQVCNNCGKQFTEPELKKAGLISERINKLKETLKEDLKADRKEAELLMKKLMNENPKLSYIDAFYQAMKQLGIKGESMKESDMKDFFKAHSFDNDGQGFCKECGLPKSHTVHHGVDISHGEAIKKKESDMTKDVKEVNDEQFKKYLASKSYEFRASLYKNGKKSLTPKQYKILGDMIDKDPWAGPETESVSTRIEKLSESLKESSSESEMYVWEGQRYRVLVNRARDDVEKFTVYNARVEDFNGNIIKEGEYTDDKEAAKKEYDKFLIKYKALDAKESFQESSDEDEQARKDTKMRPDPVVISRDPKKNKGPQPWQEALNAADKEHVEDYLMDTIDNNDFKTFEDFQKAIDKDGHIQKYWTTADVLPIAKKLWQWQHYLPKADPSKSPKGYPEKLRENVPEGTREERDAEYERRAKAVMAAATTEQKKVFGEFESGDERLFLNLIKIPTTAAEIDKRLEVTVNSVEGDWSQLVPALYNYAKKKGWTKGFEESLTATTYQLLQGLEKEFDFYKTGGDKKANVAQAKKFIKRADDLGISKQDAVDYLGDPSLGESLKEAGLPKELMISSLAADIISSALWLQRNGGMDNATNDELIEASMKSMKSKNPTHIPAEYEKEVLAYAKKHIGTYRKESLREAQPPEGWIFVDWKDSEGKVWKDTMPRDAFAQFQLTVISKGGVITKVKESLKESYADEWNDSTEVERNNMLKDIAKRGVKVGQLSTIRALDFDKLPEDVQKGLQNTNIKWDPEVSKLRSLMGKESFESDTKTAEQIMDISNSMVETGQSGSIIEKEPLRNKWKVAVKPLLSKVNGIVLAILENENFHSEVEILMKDFGKKMGEMPDEESLREGVDWDKLDQRLKNFDYTYQHSDDFSVWKAGSVAEEEVQKMVDEAKKEDPARAKELVKKHARFGTVFRARLERLREQVSPADTEPNVNDPEKPGLPRIRWEPSTKEAAAFGADKAYDLSRKIAKLAQELSGVATDPETNKAADEIQKDADEVQTKTMGDADKVKKEEGFKELADEPKPKKKSKAELGKDILKVLSKGLKAKHEGGTTWNFSAESGDDMIDANLFWNPGDARMRWMLMHTDWIVASGKEIGFVGAGQGTLDPKQAIPMVTRAIKQAVERGNFDLTLSERLNRLSEAVKDGKITPAEGEAAAMKVQNRMYQGLEREDDARKKLKQLKEANELTPEQIKAATQDFTKFMIDLGIQAGKDFEKEHGRKPSEAEAGRMAKEIIRQAQTALTLAKGNRTEAKSFRTIDITKQVGDLLAKKGYGDDSNDETDITKAGMWDILDVVAGKSKKFPKDAAEKELKKRLGENLKKEQANYGPPFECLDCDYKAANTRDAKNHHDQTGHDIRWNQDEKLKEGASYTSARVNHLNLRKIFDAVIGGEVTEANDEKYFRRKPTWDEVKDVEVGDRGESAIILKSGGIVKVNKTIKDEDLDNYREKLKEESPDQWDDLENMANDMFDVDWADLSTEQRAKVRKAVGQESLKEGDNTAKCPSCGSLDQTEKPGPGGRWKCNKCGYNYTESLREAYVPDNIKKYAKEHGVSSLVQKVAGWAEQNGQKIRGGTAIGKYYATLIMDLDYQDSAIYIDTDEGTVKLHGEPVASAADFKKVLEKQPKKEEKVSARIERLKEDLR